MIASSLCRQLDDLAFLVLRLDASTYSARPLPGISGSIGQHVRHCLDHIGALITSSQSATLCYDRRERGTNVERDPGEALRLILRLKSAALEMTGRGPDDRMFVEAILTEEGEAVSGASSLAREAAFVASHTVHHQAVIALLLAVQGVPVPERFGYAPSTPRQAV